MTIRRLKKFPIAIVGMGFRLPGDLSTPNQLWDALKNKKDLITSIDASRWSTQRYWHPRRSELGKSYTFSAGLLSQIDKFDASFFGISAREAIQMDPQQRLLLEATWEALQNGGQNPENLAGSKCAVYVGIAGNEHVNQFVNDPSIADPYTMLGNCQSIASNRISYLFDLHGPSMSIDTACSSSMVALHQACQSIWNEDAPSAIVGGVNMLLSPSSFIGFSKAFMLSPDGRCKSFDVKANGYVRGEGCVVLFLKPLEMAEKEGDPIHAVILNTGVNSDGRTHGIALPAADAQAALITQVHEEIGLTADNIDYVEAHGTGTPVGDPIEASAIGESISKHRTSNEPLLIGSIKSNIGHLEVASGLAGIVKASLCLKHQKIPATVHFNDPNPHIDFEKLNIKVVSQLTELPKKDEPAVIAINSFGFGGTNAHVVLAEYKRTKKNKVIKRPQHITPPLILSAHHETLLPQLANQYCQLVTNNPNDYYDIAYTLAYRSPIHQHGLVIDAPNVPSIIEELKKIGSGNEPSVHTTTGQCIGKQLKVALIYSGNGSQWQGMGRQLLQQEPTIRRTIESIDTLFANYADFSIKQQLLTPGELDVYQLTEIAQPCLFALQVAITRYLIQHGLQVEIILGHSVGEVAAAWASGSLSLEQAVQVIYVRSVWQGQLRGQGKLAAVSLSVAETEQLLINLNLNQKVTIAGVNSPAHVTVAGSLTDLTTIQVYCDQKRIFCRILDLDYAFHSPSMQPIRENVLAALKNLTPQKNSIGYISTVTGRELTGEQLTADYWWKNIRQPVNFVDAVNASLEKGVKVFIEVGPNPVLKSYVEEMMVAKAISGKYLATSSRQQDDLAALRTTLFKTWLSGTRFNLDKWFSRTGHVTPLPPYPWLKEHYWLKSTNEHHNQQKLPLEHPLLGHRIYPGEPHWQNHLDTELIPYLKDHVVDGVVVMPIAGFAEMALAAGKVWYQRDRYDVEDIAVLAPMVLADKTCRVVRFLLQPNEGYFEIKSRARHTDEPWVVHVVGRLQEPPSALPRKKIKVTFRSLKTSAALHLSNQAYYAYAARKQFTYGPVFQSITQVWIQDKIALAEIKLHQDVINTLKQYCLHPALLDACLQMLLGLVDYQLNTDEWIPMRLGRVRVHAPLYGTQFLTAEILKRTKNNLIAQFAIVNKESVIVAEITNCQFKRIRFIDSTGLTKTYSVEPHLLSSPIIQPLFNLDSLKLIRDKAESRVFDNVRQHLRSDQQILSQLKMLIGQFVYQTLTNITADKKSFSLGWLFKAGKINPEKAPLLKWCIHILIEDGYLQQDSVDDFSFIAQTEKIPPETTWRTVLSQHPDYLSELTAIGRFGKHLHDILRGRFKVENASTLFRQNTHCVNGVDDAIQSFISSLVAKWPQYRRLRILEIGNHFGHLTTALCGILPGDKTEYCLATQDESAFMQAVTLAQQNNFIQSIQLKLDQPLSEQFGVGESFDLVFIHGFDNLEEIEFLGNHLKTMLSVDATLLVVAPYRNRLHDTLSFLAGENSLKPSFTPEIGLRILAQAGFVGVDPICMFSRDAFLLAAQPLEYVRPKERVAVYDWLIITDDVVGVMPLIDALKAKQRSVFIATTGAVDAELTCNPNSIESLQSLLSSFTDKQYNLHVVQLIGLNVIKDKSQRLGSEALIASQTRCDVTLHLLKAIECLKWSFYPRLSLVTRGGALCDKTSRYGITMEPEQATLWGLGRVIQNEYPELQCKLIDLQGDELTALSTNFITGLFQQAENEIIVTPQALYGLEVKETDIEAGALSQAEGFRLDFLQAGPLKNLKWFPLSSNLMPAADEVIVKPLASGLNFRDIMFAMGLIPTEAVEDGFLGPTLGMEFAGEVIQVGSAVKEFTLGDKVMGFAPASFSSQVVTKAYAITHLPRQWSATAAAGVPIAFFTAFYALTYLARMQPGERLLVHGAAGGVGLAAIQLANYLGVEIYATAGSDEKRDFLAMLGIKQIYDSRSLLFADQILEQTHGEGVDVVLNCLAGEAIHANLSILRPFGRFLELGKRDFYANSKMGLRPFRNNISYFGIDADQLIVKNPALSAQLFKQMFVLFEQNVLLPLPHTEFSANQIVEAFRYMQQSRHIGKIIINFKHPPLGGFSVNPQNTSLNLESNETYLVTGGCSGFGLRTAQWLVDKGARHLVLMSRSGAASEEAKAAVQLFQSKQVEVHISVVDVTNTQAVQHVIQTIADEMPPLKGIIHAAAVFDDKLISNLESASLHKVLAPKMVGAWNLHQFTQTMDLDFFIVYSSVSVLLGNPGQANYVAANAYLESLVHQRRAQGLPGTYVAWGAIDDAGYLAQHVEIKERLLAKGIRVLTSQQALNWLEKLIVHDHSGVTIADLNTAGMQRFMKVSGAAKFKGLLLEDNVSAESGPGNYDIQERITGKSPQEVSQMVSAMLTQEIAKILCIAPGKINLDESIFNFGMDSLMGAELIGVIEQQLSVRIAMMELSLGPTIKGLTRVIVTQLCKNQDSLVSDAVVLN